MRKVFILIFAVILFNLNCGKEKKVKEIKKEELPVVKVEPAKFSPIEDIINSTGTIEADTLVKVSSKIGGKVESIYYKEGDYIQKNAVLLKLETKEILAQKAQTEAMEKQASASLENIKKNYQRMKNLYSEGIVSKQSLEQIETQLQVLESQLDATKASLNLINAQLENSIIKSPISGRIAMKLTEEGEVIGPGIPIFQIIDISNVKVKIGISEDKIKDVKINKKVRVYSSAYPDKKFEGYINFISPSANPLNRLFDVELKIPNKDEILKPGMFVRVEIITKKIENSIVVPESAIIDEEGKKIVFVCENKIAKKREVITGVKNKGNIEIIKGLQKNELVIIEGGYGLEDGTKVERGED